MNLIRRIYLFASLIFFVHAVLANNVSCEFEKGDWFECEMEFENGKPVFRNHNISNPDKALTTELISIRFENKGNSVWDYKILRYKSIYKSLPHHNSSKKLYCIDIWYPDYFETDAEHIRNSLKGSIKIEKQFWHSFDYNDLKFTYKTVSPYIINDDKHYSSSSISFDIDKIQYCVEMVFEMIFQNQIESTIDEYGKNRLWARRISKGILNEKERINEGCFRSLTKFQLPNGLVYAFSDNNKQKVLAITNASFEIPNKVNLKIVDENYDKNKLKYLWYNPKNPVHILNMGNVPGVELKTKLTNTTLQVKCGVMLSLVCSNQYSQLYIEPGDSLEIIINGKNNSQLLVNGNENNKWLQKKTKIDYENLDISSENLSAEFKAYLEMDKYFFNSINQVSDSNDPTLFSSSLLNTYFLKSYHYSNLQRLIQVIYIKKRTLNNSAGTPLKKGFERNLNATISNYQNYPLYELLHSNLKGQYSFSKTTENPERYGEFLKQCGDTAFNQSVLDRIDERKTLIVGNKIPYKFLTTANNEKINLLPPKGKYGLLHIYAVPRKISEFDLLNDSLNKNIQSISYRINLQSNFSGMDTCMNESAYKSVFGHPKDSYFSVNQIGGVLNALLILYDHCGEIIYYSILENAYYENKYPYNFAHEINDSIKKHQSIFKNGTGRVVIIFLVLISVLISLSFLFYRSRLLLVQKRNSRAQLIQELKLKSVQAQLNPHFLFNALNSIQQLVNSNQNKKANNYLTGFLSLLRGVLQNSDKSLVSISDELELIHQYCELEKLRLDFEFELVVNTQLDADLIEIPYMLFQPLVENAIKHGIAKTDRKGKLRIVVNESNGELKVVICDNGKGFNDLNIDALQLKGKGLKLAIEKLKTNFGDNAEFKIANNKNEEGAMVQIKLMIG